MCKEVKEVGKDLDLFICRHSDESPGQRYHVILKHLFDLSLVIATLVKIETKHVGDAIMKDVPHVVSHLGSLLAPFLDMSSEKPNRKDMGTRLNICTTQLID